MRPVAFDLWRPSLEAELQRYGGGGQSPFYDMLRYQMRWIDERLQPESTLLGDRVHGILTLLAAEALSADIRCGLHAAAGIELACGFAAVHEQLRLGVPSTEHRPSLWWVWGHSQGINAGDGLYALARLAVMHIEEDGGSAEMALRAVETLDRYCLELCENRYRAIEYEDDSGPSLKEVLEIIDGTEGGLMACALELGAISAGAPSELVVAYASFGRKLGVAWRLRKDLETVWPEGKQEKIQLIDELDRRRSVPIIYAYENAKKSDLELMNRVVNRTEPIQDDTIDAFIAVLDRTGSRIYVEGLIGEVFESGLRAFAESGSAGQPPEQLSEAARYLAGV